MRIRNTDIIIVKGDITDADTEAIVNAANNRFQMGGGVAGAIKRKGSAVIEQEAQRQGPVEVGEAVITSGGTLKAKYVIHAATMKLDFKTDEDIVRKAARSTLQCAQNNNVSSLAFCALGCGVGRFPLSACAKIMAQEVLRYLREQQDPSLKKIVFVLNNPEAFEIFQRDLTRYVRHMVEKLAWGPYVTVDGIIAYKEGIVLIERSNPPSGWALPGGFLDYGETIEHAVVREIEEETGLEFSDFKIFKVCSDPERDPRFQTVTIVFAGRGKGTLKAASDASRAAVFKKGDLPEKMAFDHRDIVEDYFNLGSV